MTTLNLTMPQIRIILAALTELDIRLHRGLSNSGLEEKTVAIFYDPNKVSIHESYVSELRDRFKGELL